MLGGYSLANLNVASIIEDAATGRVLVVGSLPPVSRDWDVLVNDADRAAIEARLDAVGFVSVHRLWIRLSDEQAEVVEFVDCADWRLPEDELERLFADAVPVDGLTRLCVPSPADRLLILARKLPRTPGLLEPKHR